VTSQPEGPAEDAVYEARIYPIQEGRDYPSVTCNRV
jgi:hypothetical protein